MGALTKDRVFIVTDKSVNLKLPSDFVGLKPATYEPPDRGNINSALGVATTLIKRKIEEFGLISNTERNEDATKFDKFQELVRKYDVIDEPDETKRVALKNQEGAKLGEFVISASILKSAITNLYSEGSMVALIFSVIINPEKTDFGNLEKIYHRPVQPFTRHKLLDAIEVLFTKSYISKPEFDQVRAILTFYSKDCQPALMKKIIKINEIIDEVGMIKKYSMTLGNLKLNETIKKAEGNSKLDIYNDPILNETMIVEGSFASDAIDIMIDVNGKVVSEIEYIYWDHDRFVLYAHVHAKKEFGSEAAELWMPFRTDITQIEKSKVNPATEVAVPVSSSLVFEHWKKIKVNLSAATELAFGADSWRYVNLNKLRIRGSGKLKSIILK